MKTALVTGAARGIGLAASQRFLEDGWAVAMLDRDGEELQKAAGNLPHVLAVEADVAVDSERAVAETLARFGRIDALVTAGSPRLPRDDGRPPLKKERPP